MRVFFALRDFTLELEGSEEMLLPLTPRIASVTTEDLVPTSQSSCDLCACKVIIGENVTDRFMLVTESEFMLLEPDKNQLGYGIVKFIAFLQDVDISTDPADNCALYIVAHHRSKSQVKRRPALTARFLFDDHIRCLATRQSLQRRKDTLRHSKMVIIASLLGEPPPSSPHRKRGDSLTSPLPKVGTLPFNDTTSSPGPLLPSASPSTHQHSLANQTLNTSSLTSDATDGAAVGHYELEKLDSSKTKGAKTGREEENRTPSPHVRYVHKTDTITLSFGETVTDSPVTILPPLEREIEESEVDSELMALTDSININEDDQDDKEGNGDHKEYSASPKITRRLTPPPTVLRQYLPDEDLLEHDLELPESVITQQVDQNHP
ncbi:PREDICTED: uncharacterized protein LOC100637467 [Amphimedon queenslandica]|uniref:CLEC16A/TT9 C-terminal domain-containing protein n=1 Tax=Amphimedon queenslandica TaxID=400682 RepID=A0A1X7UKD0_AMPQE|nr:PREDICTED: uncharacterized protein LOC100637467 [Amphimedon queenslandica]|eukprot:XP_003387669.2 PREDICTED: uncharacterized protein LOC100637467 [Amphimedon queenslandica]